MARAVDIGGALGGGVLSMSIRCSGPDPYESAPECLCFFAEIRWDALPVSSFLWLTSACKLREQFVARGSTSAPPCPAGGWTCGGGGGVTG